MEIKIMAVEATHHHQELTRDQLDIIEGARNTPYIVSRSYARESGERTWTHTPAVTLARDIDLVALLKHERQRQVIDVLPRREPHE